MGPPAATEHESNNPHFYRVLGALPSPTSDLNSPTLVSSLSKHQKPYRHLSPRHGLLDEVASVLPSPPAIVNVKSVVTPPADEMPEPDMNLVVGGALAPVRSSPPPHPPPRRPRPNLRLPSFELLGIAAPNPDRFGLDGSPAYYTREAGDEQTNALYAGSSFSLTLPGAKRGRTPPIQLPDVGSKQPGGRAIQSPLRSHIHTLTPPAENGDTDWNPILTVSSAMDSPSTDPGKGNHSESRRQSTAQTDTTPTGRPSQISMPRPGVENNASWIRGAIDALLANLEGRAVRPGDSLRVISHALPSPSPTGHIFSEVLRAISSSTPASVSTPMTWINVFHAIPGKFNLQDLPRSPPATPGPAIGGEDYFTEKVFDSAVSIADYQQDLSELPRSPCPVVPPNSIDVSIVERYIPPSSSNEFSSMFDTNGPSVLIDRLIELSPHNGSLLFIYPTRIGGETFMREYLGPILDPALRTLAVTQGFSADLNKSLGTMASVDQLLDYETLQHRMVTLCARLTQRSSAAERFHGRRPILTLSYAAKKYVKLGRNAWARDWWTKQEKPRLREAITKHSREAQKLPRRDHGNPPKSASELWQSLLDDVEKRAYGHGQEPEHGIEVSVFVITRSA